MIFSFAKDALLHGSDALEGGDPPPKRRTPPLFMCDILRSRNGVPAFVEDWLRLERERDARREARAALGLKSK